MSDLHINDWPVGTPFHLFVTPVAPILVIAGDICSAWDPLYRHFLAWCSRNWHAVILIAGNHEYYCEPGQERSMEQTDYEIFRICSEFSNIRFLQTGMSCIIPGTSLRFVGATLWSEIDHSIWEDIKEKKGDYKATFTQTYLGLKRTHPADITALHALHKAYLRSALAPQTPNETLIVITHHMPTKALLEDAFKGEVWHTCYASNDEDLFAPNIRLWICGHSHRATKLKPRHGPLLVMNARGYNRSHELGRATDKYNPAAVIKI